MQTKVNPQHTPHLARGKSLPPFMVFVVAALASLVAGGGPYLDVYAADSLSIVRRTWVPEEPVATSTTKLQIEMVQGEEESVQLVIAVRPWELQDAANITWSVSPFRAEDAAVLAGAEVTVAPVGYVPAGKRKRRSPVRDGSWWPPASTFCLSLDHLEHV